MGDGPSTAAKWNKYSIGEDGKLQRKAEFCKICGTRGLYGHSR